MQKRLLQQAVWLLLLLPTFYAGYSQSSGIIQVTGTVISAESGVPMPGVTVMIRGTRIGVGTDSAGRFTMRMEKGQALEFRYVGFKAPSMKINHSEELIIKMHINTRENDEVVVIGYGSRKKTHLTGAVSKIVNDNLWQIPVSRADLALMGKMAGVSVSQTDAQSGAAPTIQIRGANSVTAGTNPLIVIDGYPVPTDLSAIDMYDVESIEVLKDAASAAIYGSRGGNGVILITSKSGKTGKGKLSVNVSSGIKTVYRTVPLYNLQRWKQYVMGDNNGVIPAEITAAEKYDANIDAQDVIFRQVHYTSAQLAASGGNTTFKYYLSGTATQDDGVIIGNNYKKLGLKAAFTAKVNPKVTIDFSVTPSYTLFYNVPISVQEAIRTQPSWMPTYHNDTSSKYTGMPVGSIANQRDFNVSYNPRYTGGVGLNSTTTNNPLQQLNGTSDRNTQIRNITNFSVKIDIGNYFSLKSSVGFLYSENQRDYFQRSWAQSEAALDGAINARKTSRAVLSRNRMLDLSNENILGYKRDFGLHDIDIIGGFTTQYTNTSYFSAQGFNFATDDIPTLNAGTMQSLTSSTEEEALISYLMRASYTYDNRYLVTLSHRSDGSSRFSPDNRYAFFPSASVAWRMSNEAFFPRNRIVNEVKIRASYGATGNKNIGNYRYYSTVSPVSAILGDDNPTPGMQLTGYGNDTLKWEKTLSGDVGLDLSLFDNKVRVTLDYYSTMTNRLLLNLAAVSSGGYTTYPTNKGKLANRGFEFEIAVPVISDNNFHWNINANGYLNRNKLLDFGGTDQQINQGDPSRANFFLTKTGSPLVQYYGYKMDSAVTMHTTNYWPIGVTSLHTFVKDIDKDGHISDSDRIVLGTPYPKFNWGFTSNMQYRDFDLSITLQGSHGAQVFNVDPYYFETQYGTTGSKARDRQGYTPAQKAMTVLKTQTDYNIEDASFIALRNVNLGYTLPGRLLRKMTLAKLRLYLSSGNLWYHFANNYASYNPEADNGFPNDPLRKGYQRGAVPISRTVVFGINVEF
jgi:TonB-linked SusC/RagA family outer membrane protein